MSETTEQTPHPDYVKGFNEGYIISEHMPDVAKSFSKAESKSERTSGFKDGHNQYVLEQNKDRYPAWAKRDLSSKNEKQAPAKEDKSPDKE